jgi:RND family efflux transporter MFP subunit
MRRLPISRLLPALLALGLAGCLERTQPTVENAVRPVQTVRVALTQETPQRHYAGTLRPRREADIGFRAGGRITAREVDLGARVTAGQVLMRLDPADLALSVRSAEADLAAADAQAAQAASDAARSRTLAAQGWTAAAADEVKQAAARTAAGKQAAARAALDLARNKLDYAVLRAPTGGVITAILADPGTVAAEGQPVLRMAEAGAFEAEVALPEADMAQAGTTASVTFWAHPEIAIPATLREVAPAADSKLRTYVARYTLETSPPWLALGMSATVLLSSGEATQVASLPASALLDRGAGPMVWVVDATAGTLQARPVQVRTLRQDRAIVTGLRPDELVVSLGGQKLDPAARVRVADIRPAGA